MKIVNMPDLDDKSQINEQRKVIKFWIEKCQELENKIEELKTQIDELRKK